MTSPPPDRPVLPALVGALAIAGSLGAIAWALRSPGPGPAGESPTGPAPPGTPLSDFRLVESSGRAVTREDLVGKVWVAGFVFTRCTGPCPIVTTGMVRLQQAFAAPEFRDARLLTVTVDPKFDDANVLAEYAKNLGADRERWWFLTGGEDDVYSLVRGAFRLAAQPTPEGSPGNEVIHSTRLALVDRAARVRGYVDGTDAADVDRVPGLVKDLLAERPAGP